MHLLTDNTEMKQVQKCKIYITALKCLEVNLISPKFLENLKNIFFIKSVSSCKDLNLRAMIDNIAQCHQINQGESQAGRLERTSE